MCKKLECDREGCHKNDKQGYCKRRTCLYENPAPAPAPLLINAAGVDPNAIFPAVVVCVAVFTGVIAWALTSLLHIAGKL